MSFQTERDALDAALRIHRWVEAADQLELLEARVAARETPLPSPGVVVDDDTDEFMPWRIGNLRVRVQEFNDAVR